MVNKNSLLQNIKRLTRQFDAKAQIFIFGSRSMGTEKTDSDWDILILLEHETQLKQKEKEITSALYELELQTGQVINPMVYSKEIWDKKYRVTPFYNTVMEHRKRI